MSSSTIDFLSQNDIVNLGGAVTTTIMMTNIICYVFGGKPRYLGFAISLFISYLGFIIIGEINFIRFVIATINGFVIFSSAFGVTNMMPESNIPKSLNSKIEENIIPRKIFFKRW